MWVMLFEGLNVNISKPTLCGFVTVGMKYVDVTMYTSTEAERLSFQTPKSKLLKQALAYIYRVRWS